MKHLLTSILLLVSLHAFGQFTKGNKVVSGQFLLNVQRAPGSTNGNLINKSTVFDIVPTYGMLVSDNLEVGGQLGYKSSSYERNVPDPYIYEWRYFNLSAGAYVQRYFTISDNFLFSLTGNISYGSGKSTSKATNTSNNDITEDEEKTNTLDININPNFIFFPSKNWAIRASIGNLGYSHSNNKSDNIKSNSFNTNYGTIGLGISYYIR